MPEESKTVTTAAGNGKTPPPEPKPPPPAEEDALNPIGLDFWLGQIFMLGAAVAAIWFAARAGFTEAARFSQYDECRTAQKTLTIVRTELEENLEEIRAARKQLEEGKPLRLELKTVNLQIASSKSFGSLIDPGVLAQIEALLGPPLPATIETFSRGAVDGEERKSVHRMLTAVLDRADRVVLPMLRRQEQLLEAAELQLRGGP